MTYPGGKNGAGVFQTIISHMPPHRIYLEPFVGGGAVLRLKRPAQLSIAIDLDLEPIRCLMHDVAISRLANSRGEVLQLASLDQALSAYPGKSGVAAGSSQSARGGDHRQDRRADPLAQNGETFGGTDGSGDGGSQFWFLVGDGIALLERYRFHGDELVYCDPPYLRSTRSRRRLYRFEMTDLDHRRLLRVIRKLPCQVMISGYWSQMYADALADWHSLTFQTTNRAGKKTKEWLWSNFPEPVELHDYRYLGRGFRERERINRKKRRWVAKLRGMPILERRSLLAAIDEAWGAK